MREGLKKLHGKRIRVTARIGRKNRNRLIGRRKPFEVVLLTDVRHRGAQVAEHLWIESGYWCESLQEGDLVAIRASVRYYKTRNKEDYALGKAWLLDVLSPAEEAPNADDAVWSGA